MKYIDIPSEQLLPEMENGIKEQLKDVVIPGVKNLGIEKLEWTPEGLRVWLDQDVNTQ